MRSRDTSFRKFSEADKVKAVEVEIEDEEEETSKEKYQNYKRKPRDFKYNDGKHDVTNIFYINHRTQLKIPHSLLPNLNMQTEPIQTFESLQEHIYPYCSVTEPRPVFYSTRHCDRVDRCFRRTLAREHHRQRLCYGRSNYQNAWKTDRNLRKMEKESNYHPSLFTFAERLECDPDPFFSGNYDYYYTGGNICTYSHQQGYILHADGGHLNTVRLSKMSFENTEAKSSKNAISSIMLQSPSEILEMQPLQKRRNKDANLFGLRQLNNFKIMMVENESKNLKTLMEFSAKCTPFISFAQSVEQPDLFCISSMKQHIRIYDLSNKIVTVRNLFKMEDSDAGNWNRITAWENQTFLYANERQMCLMDLRTSQDSWLTTASALNSNDFPCNFISSLHVSSFSNLFYLGSNHNLLCVDVRCMGSNRSLVESAICEWTHQLEYAPAFIDTFNCDNREYIALASSLAGDLRICELTNCKNLKKQEKEIFKSHCMPWQPPTLEEAFEKASLSCKVLQPEADLKHRISCCTTGITFLNSNHMDAGNKNIKALLLQANSNGDVYAQTVSNRSKNSCEQRISNRSNEIMADYASKLCKLSQPTLNYTDIVDFKVMRKVLLCEGLSGKLSKVEENTNEEEGNKNISPPKRFKGRWQKPVSSLYQYKDALVNDLLSIWDVPLEDEGTDIKLSTLNKKFKVEKKEKDILGWLHGNDSPMPVTSIPMDNLRMTSSDMNITSASHEIEVNFSQSRIESELNATFDQHSSIHNTPSNMPSKPKIAKAKKKHVKGF